MIVDGSNLDVEMENDPFIEAGEFQIPKELPYLKRNNDKSCTKGLFC